MYSLRSIGVLSCAKMMGATYGCLALLLLPFLLIAALASMASGQESGALSGVAMVVLAIIAPVFYAAIGFVFGALGAWIYNLIARWIGGIELELKATVPASPAAPVLS